MSQIAGKDFMKTENSQITSIDANFSSTSHKIAISMTDLSTSHVVTLAGCLLFQGRRSHFKDQWRTCECLISLRNKRSLCNFQYWYLPELLVNVYVQLSFDGKNVHCCCVHGSWLFSNPVTYFLKARRHVYALLYNTHLCNVE